MRAIKLEDRCKHHIVQILNLPIYSIRLGDLFRFVQIAVRENKRLLMGNINIHAANLAYERPALQKAYEHFDLVFCDGFGVLLAALLTGQKIVERFTPPDFIHDLVAQIHSYGGSVFLLGAAPGVAERAALTLQRQTPDVSIAGCYHGYFDRSSGAPENERVIRQINQAKPTLLLVAFGMPAQELWLAENWHRLHVQVALPVGAMFDILAGDVPRGPRWMTDNGFEWLARLMIEPRRLWRRYLFGIPQFYYRLFLWHWLGIARRY